MDRVVSGLAATIAATFYVGDQPTDPDPPGGCTVTITRDDGTPIVTAAAAAKPANTTGLFQFTLSPQQTAQLDTLTAVWTATIGGFAQSITTTVEVAGGALFSLAAARQRSPLGNATAYPVSQLLYARTLAETALEDACGGLAFVPRYAHDVVDGGYYWQRTIELQHPRVRTVRWVTRDGNQLPSSQVAQIKPRRSGLLWAPAGWVWGVSNYEIGYEHGYDFTPPRVSRAALELARRWLVESPFDERTTRVATREGFQVDMLTASSFAFDIPEVNAVIRTYGQPLVA